MNFQNLLLNRTPGCETLVTEDGDVIERGSLWYWLQNKSLYGILEPSIDQVIAQRAPITAQVAHISSTPAPSHLDLFEVSDDWVAADVKNRLKLAWVTALVEAPLPIRTQLFKHKVGFVENEVSRRYVHAPPSFFYPETWRARAPNVKQGSLDFPMRHAWLAQRIAWFVYEVSRWGYRAILELGGCPEQARFLLSQGMMTQWYWTGSLDAVFRAIRLRSTSHAQAESWQAIQKLDALVAKRWPQTYRAMSKTS